jgi:hypothetical protein
MTSFPWIIVGIVLGLLVTGISIILAWKKRKEIKSKGTNYRAFFILGVFFLLLGVIFDITFFISSTQVFLILGIVYIAMGISYISIGLANRDKWKSKV